MTYPALLPESPMVALAQTVTAQLQSKRDLIVDTRHLSLARTEGREEPLLLLVDGPDHTIEDFGITRHAHSQLATHLGIPQKLYDRLLRGVPGKPGRGGHDPQPDLLANLANGLLAREPSKRFVRTLDGQARAFLSDIYRPRDNYELLEHVILPTLGEFPGEIEFKRCDLTDTRLYVKVVLPGTDRPITPKVGDVIRGGVIIQNSEVGNGAVGIFPYTDRLICLNGMVHTEFGQRSRHVGKRITGGDSGGETWDVFSDATLELDDKAFYAKCADTIRACLNDEIFKRIVEQMRDLAGIRLPGAPDATVEILGSRLAMSEGEQGSMLAALIEGADLSGWGYVNAITQTARDLPDADRATELERLAGGLVTDQAWAHALAA